MILQPIHQLTSLVSSTTQILNVSYSSLVWLALFPSLIVLLTGCIQSPSQLDMIEENSVPMQSSEPPPMSSTDEDHVSMMRADIDDSEQRPNDPSVTSETQNEEPVSTTPSEMTLPEPVQICYPKAITWKTEWSFAHHLRSWVLENQDQPCSLESTSINRTTHHTLRAINPFGHVGEEHCDEDGCWITLPSFAKQWTEEPNPDQGYLSSGALWTGIVDARRHTESQTLEAMIVGAHSGSTAVKEIKRRWDSHGHLLFDNLKINHQLWFETRYEWVDDRLVRIEFSDFINSTSGFDISFTYDNQERLTQSKLMHKLSNGAGYSFGYSNHWEYTDQGTPQSLTRLNLRAEEDPKPWLNMRWFYNENGQVSSRKAWINYEEMMMYRHLGDIDSYGPRGSRNQFDWTRTSLGWDDSEECMRLPTGYEYGYPNRQDHYNLGWKMNLRPEGIDKAHGYQHVYRVGMLGWFGHFGAQGDEFFSTHFTYAQQFESEMDQDHIDLSTHTIEMNSLYAEERPLREWSNLRQGSLSDLLADSTSILSLLGNTAPTMNDFLSDVESSYASYRQWEWQDDRLLRDSLQLRDGSIRTLEWNYDTRGQMIERLLKFDDGLVARHQWTYHPLAHTLPEACKITQYSIRHNLGEIIESQNGFAYQQEGYIPEGHRFAEDEEDFDSFYTYTSTVETSDDGQCRSIQLNGGRQDHHTEHSLHFDDQGRLTQQIGNFALNTFDFDFIRITYDEEFPVITKTEHLDHQGQVSRFAEEYEFDAQGRLSARSTSILEATRQEYTYTCD